ncbi:PadR family transcriptional regulator [Subtercola endophyticus]|uniref:PadR family transcriptional regulator n=1 Tax=Subtercola endophyticus TaxID=2895559 RepID=UPI0036F391C5
MSTVFGHGDLRLYLLKLLAEQPRHGYELIQELSTRFGGTYSPSAGTIYPRLAKLEDEGLVTKSTDGRKTVYSITDAGRAELDARQDDLDSIENNVSDSLRTLADGLRAGVNEAMRSLRADLAAAAQASRPDSARTRSEGRPVNYGFPAADPRSSDSTDSSDSSTGSSDSSSDSSTGSEEQSDNPTPSAEEQRQNPGDEQRRSNADALRDVELAINSFRSAVRVDLRKHAARGAVPAAAVSHFTAELKRIQAELKASLGS